MPVSQEILDLITQLSSERDAYKRNWDALCDEFSVPESDRKLPHVPRQIIERIHTYLTGYTTRRSIVERENGAAFRSPPPPPDTTKDPVTTLTDTLNGRP